MTIILDPGHGMSNKRRGVFDPGAVYGEIREVDIAMDYANELRQMLIARGLQVVRTRRDNADPAPVDRRDDIAVSYGGDLMISFHCNSTPGATGTEVFFRGEDDRAMAEKLSAAVASALGLKNRGAKTEKESQHPQLAIMNFGKCWLIELGFIDTTADRAKMLDPKLRRKVCEAIAAVIV